MGHRRGSRVTACPSVIAGPGSDTLGIDAVVHWQNAPAYDAVTGTVSQGALFRTEAAVAMVVGLGVLLRPQRSSWVAALMVAGSALGAVLW